MIASISSSGSGQGLVRRQWFTFEGKSGHGANKWNNGLASHGCAENVEEEEEWRRKDVEMKNNGGGEVQFKDERPKIGTKPSKTQQSTNGKN